MMQQKNTMLYGAVGAVLIILGLIMLLSGGGDDGTDTTPAQTGADGGAEASPATGTERQPLAEDAGFPDSEPPKPLIADELMLEVGPEMALPESTLDPTKGNGAGAQASASQWQVVAAGENIFSYKYWDIYSGLPGTEPSFLSSRESRKFFTFTPPPGVEDGKGRWFLLDGLVDPVIIIGMRRNRPISAADVRLTFKLQLQPQSKGGWGVWLGGLWRDPDLPGGRRHVISEDVQKIIGLLGDGTRRTVVIRFRRYTDALARQVTRKTTEVDGRVVHAVDFYFHSDLIMPLAVSGTKAYVADMVIETMEGKGN